MQGFLICSACGQTYAEFQKSGLLGCPVCYDAFAAQLGPLLKRLHGVCVHQAEDPESKSETLADLEAQLVDAVRREAYEEAGLIRDRILQMKAQSQDAHDV